MRMMLFLTGLFLVFLVDTALYFLLRKSMNRPLRIVFGIQGAVFLGIVILARIWLPRLGTTEAQFWTSSLITVMATVYLPKILFVVLYSFSRLAALGRFRFFSVTAVFLKYLAVASSVFFFCLMTYGFTIGRNHYKVEYVEVCISGLPEAFDGYEIVQLTDMHLGSRRKHDRGLAKLRDCVNALDPDLIVFTGDMVNNLASEMEPWIGYFADMHSRNGKYAVLGNHDYGDYVGLRGEDREDNLNLFHEYMNDMGFVMLDNASAPIVINSDTLYICGVENWGDPPFSQYGDLNRALEGTSGWPVVLLSHNPAHWKGEILGYNIPLTLSGHTHAMQMGIDLPFFRWSPARYRYPEYNGLYESDGKYLYVSRGEGYLGLHGRIGMRPEITVIRLKRCETLMSKGRQRE